MQKYDLVYDATQQTSLNFSQVVSKKAQRSGQIFSRLEPIHLSLPHLDSIEELLFRITALESR